MGKKLIIKGADFEQNAIEGGVTTNWVLGLTGNFASTANSQSSSPKVIVVDENSNLHNGRNGSYLKGKTIKKIKIASYEGSGQFSVGYYNPTTKVYSAIQSLSLLPPVKTIQEFVINVQVPDNSFFAFAAFPGVTIACTEPTEDSSKGVLGGSLFNFQTSVIVSYTNIEWHVDFSLAE